MDAHQFVYTNVEEGDSPHRRRGYQAWLFPAHFTDVQRRAVEGHLNQFDPDPRDGAAERYLSTPLFDGFHLIARSISLSEKDRFNRSGRFHAHGLILSVEDFKTLGYDPFRVIDANPFQNDPAEVIGRADWAAIMKAAAAALPPLKLELAEARPAGEASPEVVGWLVNNALRPAAVSPVRFLAVPRPPAEVLDFARRVIHALPPRFRKVVSFDTLRPLRHPHTAHLSGAVSPERLRGWTTTQKYAVVEPGKPLALTQPPSPWQELATEWATNPTLGRKDREHSCLLTEWLGGVSERLPFDPAKVSAVAVELVRRRCAPASVWAAKVTAVVEQALAEWPDPLCGFLRIRATEYIGSWSAEGLKRLRAGLTNKFIGRGLVDYFEAHPTVPLKKEGIKALFQWAKPRDRPPAAKKLVLIVYRWDPKSDVFDKAVQVLLDLRKLPLAEWFLGWCRKSLPEDAYSTPGLKAVADQLLSVPPPSDLTTRLREAWLGRVIHRLDHERRKASDPPETDDWEQVNSRVALAVATYESDQGQQLGDKLRLLLRDRAEVIDWLWSFAGAAWVAGARLTALADDGPTRLAETEGYPAPDGTLRFYLGVEIDCPEVGAGRVELAEIVFQDAVGRQHLRRSGAFPPLVENAPDYPTSEAREKLKRPRTRIGTLSAWGAVEDAVESRDAKKLARLFVKHPKTFYLAVEEYLLNKVSAEWVAFSRRRHPPSVFVGIMPKVSGPSGALIPLIRGLLESVVGLRTIQDPAPPPTSDEKPPGLRSEDDDGDEDIDSGDANGTAPVPHREPMLRWLLDCLLRSRPDTGGE